ncbi:MAG: outer membrane lipoprotein carrier protein LolA [Bacteroidales bacterium]|nr:outer membrane lipoprotein carrier protein LolA [Bacteroidales bacterium]
MKKSFLFFVCIFIFSLTFAQREIVDGVVVDKQAQSIVDAVSKKVTTDSPMLISYTMTVKSGEKTIETQKGNLLSNGDKFRLIAQGFEDYCDGKNLWHYVKETSEVELSIIDQTNNIFNFPNTIKTYSKDFRPKLIREEDVNYVIDLVPKKSTNVSKIRIVSNKSTNRIKEMIIYVRGGNTYVINFTSYKANQQVKTTDFSFPTQAYPNAEIIDLR